ncbi:MAG: SH3 domain-containing protein [Hyphomonas sp.]
MKRALLVLAIFMAQTPVALSETEGAQEPVISRFSGKPVPRFETLRWAEVNGRVGPSLNSPIAWRYNRKGLPVLIIKESGEWRHVRDPAGDEVWVHQRMLETASTGWVMRPALMKDGPARDAGSVAEIEAGVLVQIDSCQEVVCRVRAGGYRGWMERAKLWGTGPVEIRPAATNG